MMAPGADMIELFKILRGFENRNLDRFFHAVKGYSWRGHCFSSPSRDIGWIWGHNYSSASRVCEDPMF